MPKKLTTEHLKKVHKEHKEDKSYKPAEKPVKLDITFEEAIKRMAQAKPKKK